MAEKDDGIIKMVLYEEDEAADTLIMTGGWRQIQNTITPDSRLSPWQTSQAQAPSGKHFCLWHPSSAVGRARR